VDGKVAVRGLIWRGGEHAGGPSCKPRRALFSGPHIMVTVKTSAVSSTLNSTTNL
jgi:hypothetical protein